MAAARNPARCPSPGEMASPNLLTARTHIVCPSAFSPRGPSAHSLFHRLLHSRGRNTEAWLLSDCWLSSSFSSSSWSPPRPHLPSGDQLSSPLSSSLRKGEGLRGVFLQQQQQQQQSLPCEEINQGRTGGQAKGKQGHSWATWAGVTSGEERTFSDRTPPRSSGPSCCPPSSDEFPRDPSVPPR